MNYIKSLRTGSKGEVIIGRDNADNESCAIVDGRQFDKAIYKLKMSLKIDIGYTHSS